MMRIQGCHGTRRTGNLDVQLSRQGKHGEFGQKCQKLVFRRKFTSNRGKCFLKIEEYITVVVGYFYDVLTSVAIVIVQDYHPFMIVVGIIM